MAEQPIISENEEWRDILGWEGLYQISNLGSVKSLQRIVLTGKQRRPVLKPERQLHGYVNSVGYRVVLLSRYQRSRLETVHRLVCETFHGPQPALHEVAHGNGVRTDNRAANLRWATRRENMLDKVRHGTRQNGTRNPFARLTEDQVKQIRARPEDSLVELANAFCTDISNVWKIRHRKSWTHI